METTELMNLLDTLSIYRREIIRSLDTSSLKLPINMTQERVLMAILKFPDLNMKELSIYVGLEKSSLTRVTDSLIEKGFIVRTHGTQDRRRINCTLTKKGMVQAEKIEKLMMNHIDNYFPDLSQTEKEKLIDDLTSAVNTLSKYFEK